MIRVVAAVASFGDPLSADPKDYDRHARSLASGNGYPVSFNGGSTAFRPPGFPLVLAATYKLRGGVGAPPTPATFTAPGYQPDRRQVDAGRLVQAIIGILVAILVGLIAYQVWGRRVGLVSLGIAALYPPLILLGVTLYSDLLFIMFSLAAIAAALQARGAVRNIRWAALAGALGGLAWLTRTNGGLLLLPLAGLVWTGHPRLSRKALITPGVVVVAAALTIAPWTVRNAIVMGAFIPVSDQAGYGLAGTYSDTARHYRDRDGTWVPPEWQPQFLRLIQASRGELEVARALGSAARRYIAKHPSYVLQVGYCNALRELHLGWVSCGRSVQQDAAQHRLELRSPTRREAGVRVGGITFEPGVNRRIANLSVVGFALVTLLAIAGLMTRRSRAAPAVLWLAPLVLWTTVFVVPGLRFRAPIEPFLIMLAAVAVTAGWDRLRWRLASVRPRAGG